MRHRSVHLFRNGVSASLLSLIPLALYSQEPANANTKPNILVIVADDLGYGDLSFQGATDLRTPNIDRIFAEGMQFTRFYANSTVCSPTRASLLTGRYPDLVGVPGVIRTKEDDSWGFLTPNAKLLPGELKKAGYQTALIGKWHLGLSAPNLPNKRGFDYFHGFLGDMMDDYTIHLRHGNNYMRLNEEVVKPDGHATDVFTDWALNYLDSVKNSDNPFFMYLAYNAPHDPVQPPDEWLLKVRSREKNVSEKRARLVALIEHLDWNIGRVLSYLEKSGKLKNTLVVFTSDNGGVLSLGANNGRFRGGKQDMYEGGIRVSTAFMWKKWIIPGSSCSSVALTMDLFPTLCEVAGSQNLEQIDGLSLWPILSGVKKELQPRTIFFVRREGNLKYGGLAYYAARSGDLKILQNTPWEPMQFFNLENDPFEMHPMETEGNREYESLLIQLTRHIRLAGAVPWQSNINSN